MATKCFTLSTIPRIEGVSALYAHRRQMSSAAWEKAILEFLKAAFSNMNKLNGRKLLTLTIYITKINRNSLYKDICI